MWTRRKFFGASLQTVGAVMMSPELLAETASASSSPPRGEGLSAIEEATPSQAAVSAAQALLTRLLGKRSQEFQLAWISKEDGREVYELAAAGGLVTIKGSSAVAICRGAYSYLRETCYAMVCWSGRRLDLPGRLPDFACQRVVCPYRFTQYLNPCTFGYTAAFWNWKRWEQELDWMALHGINMPLAMEGQEAIWQKVWLSFGVSQAELDEFSTGPAQLPWHRMGNINNFAGPLTQSWIEQKKILQKKILQRMRELGMTPIAPGFSGFVPQGLKRVYPQMRTATLLWLPEEFHTIPRNTKTFVLHPGESALYKEISRRFIWEYKAEFGEVSYYLADSFNELTPPVREEHRYEDLEQFGRTIYEAIQAGDPSGTWVMQGWMFVYGAKFWDNPSVKALLSGVPNDRLLIIDYANDLLPTPNSKYAPDQWKVHEAFWGKQWINGMAHTFGGNNSVKGNLKLMAAEPAEVLHNEKRGNLVGWGICPEGIESNEVVYELMTDMGWSSSGINLDVWLTEYCLARYGAYPPAMKQAWELLLQSAYSTHIWMTKQGWQMEPTLQPTAVGVDSGPTFQKAVQLFLSCSDPLISSQFYRNDLIELVVQAVGGNVDHQLSAAGEAHKAKCYSERDEKADAALSMLQRMDALMDLRADRQLTGWIDAARSWARSQDEAAYYDENARLLITFWGWPELSDYAARVWAGLIRDYYHGRWKRYFASLRAERNTAFDMDIWEQTWLSSPYQPSAAKPVVDLVAEVRDMLTTSKDWA
ncbi:MAG TPA: alpha-N-acetylglucosaminidase [Candidatus Angelobacter sp.]